MSKNTLRIETIGKEGRAGRKPDPARVAATLCGASHYRTVKNCPLHCEGGLTLRYTRTGACVLCHREHAGRWKANNPEKNREHGRTYQFRRYWRGLREVREAAAR